MLGAARRVLAAMVGVAAFSGLFAACTPQGLLAIMPGVINDPGNRTLRREILSYGTSSLCTEMLKRSIPLRLRDDDPSIGRFFPKQCTVRELENQNLYFYFGGSGYAWSNLTKRIGFNATAAVEYDQDFQLDGSTMYIYFRPKTVVEKKLEVAMVEQGALPQNPLTPFLPGASPQGFANQVGDQLLAHQIARGFTVIRESDGTVAFGMGMVPKGERPAAPYERKDDDRVLYMNERIEIHQEQREYAGPFEVPDDDMALYLTLMVEGAPGIDLSVVARPLGEVWLQTYTSTPQTTASASPPILEESVTGAALFRRVVRVPKGQYFVVLDNTSTSGRTSPPNVALDDRAALVSLGVELGDAP